MTSLDEVTSDRVESVTWHGVIHGMPDPALASPEAAFRAACDSGLGSMINAMLQKPCAD